MHKDALVKERDMPWELTDAEKDNGMAISHYWLDEVVGKDRILFVKEFPRNALGKVQKNLLRDRDKDLYL